jgi:hypothetical protein
MITFWRWGRCNSSSFFCSLAVASSESKTPDEGCEWPLASSGILEMADKPAVPDSCATLGFVDFGFHSLLEPTVEDRGTINY